MNQKIALVTGSNKNIGFEIARGLAEAGNTVIIAARKDAAAKEAATQLRDGGGDAHAVVLDVTEDDSVAAAASWVDTEFGRLDILVNNAGVARVEGAAMAANETSVDGARATFETNFFGVLRVTNAFLPLLRESVAPRVVNVSSNLGSNTIALNQQLPTWQIPGSVYGASKAALNRLTVSYAKEFWDSKFKFNAVCPGYCATDLNGHSGYRTAAQGAAIAIELALIDADGPNGGYFAEEEEYLNTAGALPW